MYGTNALQVSDKRGKLHNVHITDVRKINMTEKIAAQLQEAYNNKGRTAKHLIPQGRIPDLGWNTDQQGKERPNTTKNNPRSPCDPNYASQAEGPPSSRLRSTSKLQHSWIHIITVWKRWITILHYHRTIKCTLFVKPGLDGKQL